MINKISVYCIQRFICPRVIFAPFAPSSVGKFNTGWIFFPLFLNKNTNVPASGKIKNWAKFFKIIYFKFNTGWIFFPLFLNKNTNVPASGKIKDWAKFFYFKRKIYSSFFQKAKYKAPCLLVQCFTYFLAFYSFTLYSVDIYIFLFFYK